MRIVIAGGHGKIALRLERLLAARNDTPVGLIRNPDHAADVEAAGAEPVVIDLENTTVTQLTEKVMGADAVVFAAGAGPGSGAARKATVDRDAARLLADAASLAGVRRYIMVSAIGVDDGPAPGSDPVWAAYVEAKRAADDDLRQRSLETDWTILRPGRLTDDAGTGKVWLAPKVERGEVAREDVAAVIVALLDEPATIGQVLELVGGTTPIAEAVRAVGA
ncbi:SDR family oxidoreductase [Streptomonospora nanhaiensis]|uniref:Nucleoside-diphosphate-sugar epimerase n=1 Tax=Streptomonospora nanhaiensis TaxID=1323731 RepID=A0A853BP12_9ACTN|nr:SDR family oxidoreductase [Streptomonospora nanhaiensis]MBX9388338.1 SDR family oxidoreductase [Streptomonospora nanhaiensis]NYI96367.1 nucleoside-diphosphate-sugar epimerase [Streptomonospora nanhaiensis]